MRTTEPGGVVFDLFTGSGTTLLAAAMEGHDDKYDFAKHPNYKYLSNCDERNAFDWSNSWRGGGSL